MLRDFGVRAEAHLLVDASAAIGKAERKGLGKVRHIDCQALWIQDAVRSKRIKLEKVLGTENPADLMTKYKGLKAMDDMLRKMGISCPGGRAESAPAVGGPAPKPGHKEDENGSGKAAKMVEFDERVKVKKFNVPEDGNSVKYEPSHGVKKPPTKRVYNFEAVDRAIGSWADATRDEEKDGIDNLEAVDAKSEYVSKDYENYEPNDVDDCKFGYSHKSDDYGDVEMIGIIISGEAAGIAADR